MAFWAYILKCADGRYYTGHTDNLELRLAQHREGGFCRFTASRRPVQLVWSEEFPSRVEALQAELQIKKWSQAKKQALIDGNWELVSFFAKPPNERLSTSLEQNGSGEEATTEPFVSSEVETRLTKSSFVSSEVETRSSNQ